MAKEAAMAHDERSRLGRGLAALIGDVGDESAAIERTRSQKRVPIEFLKPNPRNPRRYFAEAELEELAASIRERGIIQPILVRTARGAVDQYEIIAGERRWRAAQRAGLHDVPVVLLEVTDREALELAIIENVQRADLNALEEASGYQALDRRVQIQPGRHREDRRQEPQPRRQHAAADEAARQRAVADPRRQALAPATRARCSASPIRRRWRRRSSRKA